MGPLKFSRMHYAHSISGRPEVEWQRLEDHLRQVAELAEVFAGPLGDGWGRLAGLWHDAGKFQGAFQKYIRQDADAHVKDRVDHSSVGAVLAREKKALTVPFVVAGHHAGLANRETLIVRLKATASLLMTARRDGLPAWIETERIPTPPDWLQTNESLSFWTRLLFSALVDADFLDTERFYAGGTARELGGRPDLAEMKRRLDDFVGKKSAGVVASPVNDMRARVLGAARVAAGQDPGIFTLTVPTGGGKTLTSLTFALDHAVRHGLRRVIVVIPYTSIIEQTAEEYRRALGRESVLEHHTNVEPKNETARNRLAAENWDAPLVVTTNVQFFESLFANRTSRCRKLHRILRSVVVFDEVQTFPPNLLAAVKYAIGELTEHYGVTALLCTATQPVLFPNAREIVSEPAREFEVVAERCEVAMPQSEEPVAWDGLAAELREHEQVMAIVHRRDDAQQLAELVGEDCLHLSARMCAEHRSAVLALVKDRLRRGERCRLVATQLVEAGVDVSFPDVYRAFAGADSLAQAAGRCNREGLGSGRLHVFMAPSKPPKGVLRTGAQLAQKMWKEGDLDLKSPETFTRYLRQLYRLTEQDAAGVMTAETGQDFKDVAERFRMIDESGEPVVAPYGEWERLVADVRNWGISRERMRPLQRLTVNLYAQEIRALESAGAVERIADTFWVIVPGFEVYTERFGFGWAGEPKLEPEHLIA